MPFPSSLRLLGAGAHSAKRGQDFPPHRHSCWELVFYREGRIEMPMGDEVFLTRPGLLLLTPPGVTHAERALTAYSNYHLLIEAPASCAWPRQVSDDAKGSLAFLFCALVEEWSSDLFPPPSKPLEDAPPMRALLLAQLEVMLHRAQSAAPIVAGERLVREAERIFEEALAGPLSIESVAARIGVAPSVLRAHFARHRGCSPSAALLRVRLRQAFSLLQSSDLSLREIAVACGFHSSSHLSRHVKDVTGESPGHWRKKMG